MADKGKIIKKTVAGVLSFAVFVGAVAGGMAVYKNVSKKPVNVYAVSDLALNALYYEDSQVYGNVTAAGVQKITLSDTQTVSEIYVTEGQEVHAGDKLMAFDTTLTEVNLKKAEINVQKAQLELDQAEKELKKLGVLGSAEEENGEIILSFSAENPVLYMAEGDQQVPESQNAGAQADSSVTESGQTVTEGTGTDQPGDTGEEGSGTGTASEPENSTQAEDTPDASVEEKTKDQENTDTEEEESEQEEAANLRLTHIGGKGTLESPVRFLFPQTYSFELNGANLEKLMVMCGDLDPVYLVLEVHRNDDPDEDILHSWGLVLNKKADKVVVSFYALPEDKESTEDITEATTEGTTEDVPEPTTEDVTPTETEEPDADYYDDGDSGVSWAELQQQIKEQQNKVRDLKIVLELAKIDLRQKQAEYSDGVIYSKLDGFVKKVRDAESAYINNEPVIEVSAGGGYYITASVNELQRDSLQVGETLELSSWTTGEYFEGTVSEISDQPVSNDYNSEGASLTYYSFTVFADEDQNLAEGDICGVTLPEEADNSNALYLEPMMIRTEAGHSYVYVMNEQGRLEKRTLTLGNGASDSIKVTGGITMDDYIAFPYGDAKEGAKAQIADVMEMYGY